MKMNPPSDCPASCSNGVRQGLASIKRYFAVSFHETFCLSRLLKHLSNVKQTLSDPRIGGVYYVEIAPTLGSELYSHV